MNFYSNFSKYYDDIFPFKNEQYQFIEEISRGKGKILDLACGTGTYAIPLALNTKSQVVAIDLDTDMIKKAKEKGQKSQNLSVYAMDMLEISKLKTTFDFIYCIGNSIPHLILVEDIKGVLGEMYKSLAPQGKILLQIVNYDKRPDSLPTIENLQKKIRFKRSYSYVNGLVDFCTTLEGPGFSYEGKLKLYPIISDQLVSWLKDIGFKDIMLFGDFNGGKYNPQSSNSLIVTANKQ